MKICTVLSVLLLVAVQGTGQLGNPQLLFTGSNFANARDMAIGDFQFDGDVDIYYASDFQHGILRNDGQVGINFSSPFLDNFIAQGTRSTIGLGDIDLDGLDDVLISNDFQGVIGWLKDTTGTGTYGSTKFLYNSGPSTTNYPINLNLVDWDLDGDLDVIFRRPAGTFISIYLNDSLGHQWTQQTLVSGLNGIHDIMVFDFDLDGDMDIMGNSNSGVFWMPNLAGFGLGAQQILLPGYSGITENSFADIDGDGDLDILTTDQNSDLIEWHPHNGGGGFFPAQLVDNGTVDPKATLIEDIDNDGLLDIVAGTSQGMYWYKGQGGGSFSNPNWACNLQNAIEIKAADTDSDGDKDLIVRALGIYLVPNYIGSPYSIEGEIYYDLNSDGQRGPLEPALANLPILTNPFVSTPFSNQQGAYKFYTDTGTYAVYPDSIYQFGNLWNITSGPSVQTIQLSAGMPIVSGVDFGFTPDVDTSLVIPTSTIVRQACGTNAQLYISAANYGTRIESGTLSFTLDSLYSTPSAIFPPIDSIVGRNYYWTLDSLLPFDTFQAQLTLTFPGVSNLGDTIIHQIQTIHLDSMGQVNGSSSSSESVLVSCAYDPNDKQAAPLGFGYYNAIDINTPFLDYTIRFQNTGTDTAYTVILEDEISDKLDLSDMQILASSHTPTEISIAAGGALRVSFENILLPDSGTSLLGSKGFFRFRLPIDSNFAFNGQVIENDAAIYFDLNPPIITNLVSNTLIDCDQFSPVIFQPDSLTLGAFGISHQWFLNGVPVVGADSSHFPLSQSGNYHCIVQDIYGCSLSTDTIAIVWTVQIEEPNGLEQISAFPNPSSGLVQVVIPAQTLNSLSNTGSLPFKLIDGLGRIVRYGNLESGTSTIDIRSLGEGTYSLRVGTNITIRVIRIAN